MNLWMNRAWTETTPGNRSTTLRTGSGYLWNVVVAAVGAAVSCLRTARILPTFYVNFLKPSFLCKEYRQPEKKSDGSISAGDKFLPRQLLTSALKWLSKKCHN